MPVKRNKTFSNKNYCSGIGKIGLKRFYRNNKEAILGITNTAIKRLARKGGVKRLSSSIYDEVRACLKNYIDLIVKDCVIFTEHAKRKTISVFDIINSLKRKGKMIYGF